MICSSVSRVFFIVRPLNGPDSNRRWWKNPVAGHTTPKASAYDVVIVGRATMAANTAWFVASNPDFKGRVLIVEPDPTFAKA